MKLKVYATKVHSVDRMRDGVYAILCDTIEDEKIEGREIFLSKKQYDMVKKRGYYYISV